MAQDPSSLKTTGGWFILMSARCMVDHPDAVRVTEIRGSQTTVLELSVDRSDYKRVIGHRGRTADALRSLLLNIAGKEQKHLRTVLIKKWTGFSPPTSSAPKALHSHW